MIYEEEELERMHRRTILKGLAVAAALLGGASSQALAQADYPTKPVTVIVPYAAGGTADVVIRIVADQLSQRLGQPFVIENKVGAGGTLGAELIANAPADGYTIGLGSVSNMATQVTIRSDLPYDPRTDLTPIVLVSSVPSIMVANADLGVKTAPELVELSKSRPGQLNYGSLGAGTAQHLAAELFKIITGADLTHVPYGDPGVVVTDLTNGRIHVTFENLTNVLGQIQAGNFVALGISTRERWPSLPDVPTMAEQGLPEFNVGSWVAVFGPDGIPDEIVSKLNAEVNAILETPEISKRLLEVGVEPLGGTPEELGTFVANEIETYRKVIETAGIPKT